MKILTVLISFFVFIGAIDAQPILSQLQQEIQTLAKKLSPSIVQVHCERSNFPTSKIRQRLHQSFQIIKRGNKMQQHLLLKKLPGVKFPLIDRGLGIILDKQGYILTNDFVKNAKNISVSLSCGKKLNAKVKGIDPYTHIALLKVTSDNLHPIVLGNSDDIKCGSFVLTFGNPYGIGANLSFGISGGGVRPIFGKEYFPINVAVNPGDRGGAVFNIKGELLGLVEGVIHQQPHSHKKLKLKLHVPQFNGKKFEQHMRRFSKNLQRQIEEEIELELHPHQQQKNNKKNKNEEKKEREEEEIEVEKEMPIGFNFATTKKTGTGMALAINYLKPVIHSLQHYGQVKRGWLGVQISVVSPMIKSHLPLLQKHFALQINEVFDNSPAQQAGLRQWDILLKFNGSYLKNFAHFQRLVTSTLGPVNLGILRGAKIIIVQVDIQPRK